MTKTATVYVIDPRAATIQAVEIEARSAFSQTYKLIDCRLVEVVPFDSHHKLMVDEEGLRDGLDAYSTLDGYPQALAGKLVLVGDDEGDFFAEPKITIEDAAKRFRCLRPVLDPVFSSINEDRADVFVIGTMLSGFESRLESQIPTVIGGRRMTDILIVENRIVALAIDALAANIGGRMSRHTVIVIGPTRTDDDAIIGYDPPLRTFFLQAFPDPETDVCALWLGGLLREFKSLESIIETARAEGFEVQGLGKDATVAMTKEAGVQTRPSVGERLGIVR